LPYRKDKFDSYKILLPWETKGDLQVYDFSKGERGKFYSKNVKLNLPIYLEPKTLSFVKKIADQKNSDISSVVNDLIKTDMKITQ